jgi:isocitrate dehydrogenase
MTSTNQRNLTVTLIEGDGVGPEVTGAARHLIELTGAPLRFEEAIAGGRAFDKGILSGVPGDTIDSISQNRVVLKGPLATPIGHGQKSANVTLRKLFETFANIRPARELPGITTPFSGRGIDLTIVRENVEDLYAGIEHMQTPNVAQCLKLITRLGTQRVAHAAYAWAKAQGSTSVTVATKANIMKLTEGMFQKESLAVGQNYPGITSHHMLIDNAAHQLVVKPEQFDVILTTNMNGDILSDLASGLVGGLGVAPSANIGYEVQMFEAVHGTAPDIAGKDIVNPTAMILSAVMMLRHLGFFEEAESLEQALFLTLEEGIVTSDINPGNGVGTTAFTEAIAARLGKKANTPSRPFAAMDLVQVEVEEATSQLAGRHSWGVDVFVETSAGPAVLGKDLTTYSEGTGLRLQMISNRGTAVWPVGDVSPSCVDHYRCRFQAIGPEAEQLAGLPSLLERIGQKYRWMHIEKLDMAGDEPLFTMAQGQN